MGPIEQDMARAEELGYEPMDEDMTFSSSHWEPTHAATGSYEGIAPEDGRPRWLPRDIITAATPDEQEAVRHVQRALRVRESGFIDPETRSAILGVQRLFGLTASGVLDGDTARCVDRLSSQYGGR